MHSLVERLVLAQYQKYDERHVNVMRRVVRRVVQYSQYGHDLETHNEQCLSNLFEPV